MNRLVLFLWIVLNFASVYSWTRWGSRKTTQHRHRTTAAVNLSSLSQEDISVSNHVLDALLTYRAVCLDVDSTVLCEEGIDELARMKGLYDQIAVLNTRYITCIFYIK